MAAHEFDELCQVVAEASSPDEVFAALRLSGRDGWRSALRDDLERLRAVADPSKFSEPGARQAAEIVRKRLEELYAEALGEGGAPAPPPDDAPGYRQAAPIDDERQRFSVHTANGGYEVTGVLARGDIATIYEGRATIGAQQGRRVVLKIAESPQDNDLMLDEVASLEHLWAAGGSQRKHLPRLFDHFRTPDGRVGAVLERLDGFDLLEVRQRLPGGVPPEHTLWILRRVLSILGYAHRVGVLHANIEPSHIIVRPRDHNVFLVDWCYSLITPARTGRGFKCEIPGFSAPEVGQRKPPIPASDLYSVGKCAAFLLGAEAGSAELPDGVDGRLARLVRHLVRPSPLQRAQDAWEMFEELGKIRRAMFGRHTFQEFTL
jgi:serine/threonine protein kinase